MVAKPSDRIQGLRQTLRSFTAPENFNAKEYFCNWFGIVHDETNYKPQKIRLKVWDRQMHYFRTLKLHGSQQEVEVHDD